MKIHPIAAFGIGFGGWWLWKRIAPGLGLGGGNEPKVYDRLFSLSGNLKKATSRFEKLSGEIADGDMRIQVAGSEIASAANDEEKLRAMRRADELRRQRNGLALEAGVLVRNVIVPLREKLIAEDARLKSAIVAPSIALKWSGKIPGR